MKTAKEWLRAPELDEAIYHYWADRCGSVADRVKADALMAAFISDVQMDARDTAIEDAAKACEAQHAKHCGAPTRPGDWDGYTAFEHCAGTIRAMKADVFPGQVLPGDDTVKP